MRALRFIAGIAASSIVGGCGAGQLPPPAPPEKVVPIVAAGPGPLAPTTGRVILDAQDERARVREVTGVSIVANGHDSVLVTGVTSRPVCVTPCVADLSFGAHELVFSSQRDPDTGSSAIVDIGAQPSVFRHAMGGRRRHNAQRVGGWVAMILGGLGVATGFTLSLDRATTVNAEGTTTASPRLGQGLAIAGVSGAVLLGGVLLYVLGRSETQPGASTQWTPAAPALGGANASGASGQNALFRF